jgi:hypothetical protein
MFPTKQGLFSSFTALECGVGEFLCLVQGVGTPSIQAAPDKSADIKGHGSIQHLC